jgi:dTDP-4-dehydrorhamnose 3,5-epimerase
MIFTPLHLPGALEIQLQPRGDHRGYFMRNYCEKMFAEHGLVTHWVQDNQSLSTQVGTIRGMHFQYGAAAETKLVRALMGRVLDVIVDVRKDSATFGQHAALELSSENHKCIYVPKGFAHGFCVLEAPAIVAYKVDHFYSPGDEGGLLWSDPALCIPWPIKEPITSEKDSLLPPLAQMRAVELPSFDHG